MCIHSFTLEYHVYTYLHTYVCTYSYIYIYWSAAQDSRRCFHSRSEMGVVYDPVSSQRSHVASPLQAFGHAAAIIRYRVTPKGHTVGQVSTGYMSVYRLL